MATTKRDTHRTDRVASRIHQEVATMLQRDYADPRLAGVVLSHVEVTADLSAATARFVVMGDGDDHARAKNALKVLRSLAPGMRAKLAKRIDIRRAPELAFAIDEGREEVAHLDKLLDEVGAELKASAAKREGGGAGGGAP